MRSGDVKVGSSKCNLRIQSFLDKVHYAASFNVLSQVCSEYGGKEIMFGLLVTLFTNFLNNFP